MRIALAGLAGSGKTTLADYLEEHHGFYKVNFTDSIKESLAEELKSVGILHGSSDVCDAILDMRGEDKDKWRSLLMAWAAYKRFDEGETITNDSFPQDAPNVVFDNVRYTEQADKLRAMGFSIVWLGDLPEDYDMWDSKNLILEYSFDKVLNTRNQNKRTFIYATALLNS